MGIRTFNPNDPALQHRIQIDSQCLEWPDFHKVDNWCQLNLRGEYFFNPIRPAHQQAWVHFASQEDAMFFQLKWAR